MGQRVSGRIGPAFPERALAIASWILKGETGGREGRSAQFVVGFCFGRAGFLEGAPEPGVGGIRGVLVPGGDGAGLPADAACQAALPS